MKKPGRAAVVLFSLCTGLSLSHAGIAAEALVAVASNFARPATMFDNGKPDAEIPAGVVNITPDAGDVVLFSELLSHGVRTWRCADRERRMINFRYKMQHRGYEHRFEEGLK
ncbi:MAG TPA: hypothetical protein DEA26_05610, partial [Oceanospirillales bacterium]|nr:hypothetical protein [Oceanospirillales bacterium]